MNDIIDDAWFEQVLREVHADAPGELRASVARLLDQADPTAQPPDPPGRPWTWLSIAAALALIVTGLAFLTDRGGSPSIAPPDSPSPSPVSTTTATTMPAEPDQSATTDEPAQPTSFPVWPDPGVTVTSDHLSVGWGGAPLTVAVIERASDRADPVVIGSTPATFETVIADTGGQPSGDLPLADGTTAQLYELPGGTLAVVWQTTPGSTMFVVGADPTGLVDALRPVVLVAEEPVDGTPSFALGAPPAGYTVAVAPTYVPWHKAIAVIHVRDPFDRLPGVADVEASPYPGVLSALFAPPLEPTELPDGTPAWWTRLPDRDVELLTWQQDDRTWVRALGTDRAAMLGEVSQLAWVDEETWTQRYRTDEDDPTPPVSSAPTVEEISAQRAAALAALPGYRATQTITGPGSVRPAGAGPSRQITVLADGRAWAEDAGGNWASADPTTGTYTGFYAATDHLPANVQIMRVPDGSAIPMGGLANFVLIAADPTAPLSLLPPTQPTTIEVDDVTHDGRRAWRITQQAEATEITVRYEAVTVLDVETGLIVETRTRKWDADGDVDDHGGYTLTDVEVATTLPPDFPGVVPDGTTVGEMPLTTGLRRVTREQAAAEFDPPGMLVPSNPHGEVEYYVYDPALAPPTAAETKRRQVTIRISDGFDQSEVVVTGFEPDPALTVEDDGIVCYDLDANGRCDHLPEDAGDVPVDRVGVGALAGRKIGYGAEGQLWIFDVGRYIEIRSTDLLRAGFIANDLEPA